MEVGDTVGRFGNPEFRGTILNLPRSVGRKRPRALVSTLTGQEWIPIDELTKVTPNEAE